ncbi:MAG: hypothetical protein COA79_18140 [Planctomycetota bacterium]|nr:MAG: hypothetical protein COA79_18140 [Planctomycetota bacterium]
MKVEDYQKRENNLIKAFFLGCAIGLSVSLIIGKLGFPDKTSDGGDGYFMSVMLVLVPSLTIIFGIVSVIITLFISKPKDKGHRKGRRRL